jgi:hypothetical protein
LTLAMLLAVVLRPAEAALMPLSAMRKLMAVVLFRPLRPVRCG